MAVAGRKRRRRKGQEVKGNPVSFHLREETKAMGL